MSFGPCILKNIMRMREVGVEIIFFLGYNTIEGGRQYLVER